MPPSAGPLPLFPTTVVGSWPRPQWLLDAFATASRQGISAPKLTDYMDDAVTLAIKEQEEAGIDLLSDGEQRRFSFLTVIGERASGFRLMNIGALAKGRPAARRIIKQMQLPTTVTQPVAVEQLERRRAIAVDEVRFARTRTTKPLKVALPSPYMLAWQAWDDRYSREAYRTPDELGTDLARLLREEIRELQRAGAQFIQLDDPTILNPVQPEKYMRFLQALLGHRSKALKEELAWAAELVNRTVQGITGVTLGFHVCRGNWPAPEDVLQRGDYAPILPTLLDLKVAQFVLEFTTPRAGTVDVFREYPTDKELGLGVVDVKRPEVESPGRIRERAERALRYFDPEQLYLNPDCGFASGRTWPVANRSTPQRKLTSMVAAARELRLQYST